jgi:hypothetical protein
MSKQEIIVNELNDLFTGVDNRIEHNFHTQYDHNCSKCYERGNLVIDMLNKMPTNIIKFTK